VELKEGWNPESVLHTLCAFANGHGPSRFGEQDGFLRQGGQGDGENDQKS
jgi:hypothetical protein